MNWKDFDAFVAMGGYGFYVWGSYLVTAVLIVAEILALRMRRRAAEQARQMRALLGEQEVNHENAA
jgi:heme exporter protein D